MVLERASPGAPDLGSPRSQGPRGTHDRPPRSRAFAPSDRLRVLFSERFKMLVDAPGCLIPGFLA